MRAHSKNTRSETAKKRASTNIVRDLLICISNKTYEDLLREKLRGAPIEMKVNAALHLRVRILEIVSKPRNTRKCVSRRRIQIGVASASIDGAMTETEVRDAIWIIGADGDVSGCVGHEVMNARVPLKCHHRIGVADRRDRISDAPHARCRKSSQSRRKRPVDRSSR